MSQEFPNLSDTTQRAKKKRAALIEKMGGKCVKCGEDDPCLLQFDHIFGRNYNPNQLSYLCRMNRNAREFEAGLVRLLCEDCNLKERVKHENGNFARTQHAGQVKRTAEMPY